MWFLFPKDTDQITVEQQNFTVEAEDEDGNKFFRAPDHFAPTILALPGFSRAQQPEGAPDDLPKEDPKRADALDQLSAQLEALKLENERLRDENRERQAKLEKAEAELSEVKAASVDEEGKEKSGEARSIPRSVPAVQKESDNAGSSADRDKPGQSSRGGVSGSGSDRRNT
jgi:hypothetical protein